MRRTSKNIPKGYDSWLEYDLHQQMKSCIYHPDRIPYVQFKMYEPDFVYQKGKHKVYIEAKGRFRDTQEARKYKDIADGLADYEELVFIFQNPNTPMPNSKRRTDGTRFSHGDWADKWKFRYYTPNTLPKEWL